MPDWQTLADVAQVVATVALAVTFIQNRKQLRITEDTAKRSASESEAAAERAERASALTIDTLARIAQAVEGVSLGGSPARVEWRLTHDAGNTYRLQNAGAGTALDVVLTGHESMRGPSNIVGGPTLGPGEALTFLAALHLGTTDTTVTVGWNDEDGTDHQWRSPLPWMPR